MEIPVRKIDKFARQVRFISEGCGQAIREGGLARGNPDFPIHSRRAEGKVITGNATDMGGADDDGALKVPGEMCERVAEEEGSYVQLNARFPAYASQHIIEGHRCFYC